MIGGRVYSVTIGTYTTLEVVAGFGMISLRLLVVVVATVMSNTALADNFVFGIGRTDFDDGTVSLIELEYHFDPVWRVAGADISAAGALAADDDGDFFIGAGLSALRPLQNGWFVEGSFMPGYFENESDATDLGNELVFRTLIGVGRQLSNGTRLSLGLSHKSNAGLGDRNPGVNALTLRLRF